MIFFKWSLLILFFSYWAGWEFNFVDFSKKNIVNCYSVSPIWFLFCCSVSPHVFFLNHLYWIYFFNIELVENLALAFPTCFFFLFCFFSKNCLLFFVCFFRIVFVDFLFYYWAGWEFSFLVFYLKHYGLLQCFSTWFF